MKKWIYAVMSIFFFVFSTNALADTANTNADDMAAQNVIQNWFAAMKDQQLDKAASFLAPQFMSMHTDGITRDKAGEMALIKNLHMKAYHLTDFQFSQSGDAIVVTYKDLGTEKIDNQPIGAKAASRIAVLQKQSGNWVILAYANLDQIK